MFYDNFIKSCNLKGKTPSAALSEAGIDKSASTRWKNGKKPTDATLRKLADYFGVSPSELLGEMPAERTHPDVLKKGGISPYEWQLLQAYRNADDARREIVQAALKPFGLCAAEDAAM